LAEAYRLNNEEEKAIAELISYYNDYPEMEKTPVVLSQLGRIFLTNLNYKEAERYFSLLDQRFTAYKAEALTGLGNVELGRQDYEKARGYFQTALRLFPNNETVKLGLAKVHFEMEEDELAIPQLTEIAQKNTGAEGAEAQFLLGRILQDQNNLSEALNAFAKVKILYEAYEYWVAKALYESAMCYQKLGNPVEAQKTLKLIIELYADTQAAKEASALLNQ
jgi:TolA-binding protein